ncbi:fumarate hydratase C-terminal domain-containing protein [Roseomonas sp. PWR1]|uniref:Fumarate hydratase C-terminal domain-containing protein n=1 Tax=Roseomonas nitratireducens TaxID=2820810 RepID=A0ABS4ATW4_9PROT|nr:fumarate hydratase C-terminal domain-containing protein [Neoroseomonas nitratireducens]MBP0464007.1 fumarate hydratase C-terminal domain-containing protein [Neoroseomonas nitratireducens]
MSDAFRTLRMPMSREDARSLRAGDMVLLEGEIVITAGLPTIQRLVACAEEGRDPPIALAGGSLFHLGSYSQEMPAGGLEILYMNPTTSTRFNPLMPRLIRHFGLTAVGGKGGLDTACAAAMREVGCVYLSFLGGGAPLHSAAIRAVREVAYPDLVAHYRLVRLAVEGLGPVTVGIDAHGNSLFETLQAQARDRMEGILATLAASRQDAKGG